MKRLHSCLIAASLMAMAACSYTASTHYDGELCRDLSAKIESRDSLTSRDYSDMIGQNEAILQYLVDRSRSIAELPDSMRSAAWRSLTADPEYLERFGYMFTIGSALYRADNDGRLDSRNAANYAALDKYNEQLIEYSERF